MQWICKNYFKHTIEHVIVAGDSAGGNLAASVSYLDSISKIKLIRKQILFYPILCLDPNEIINSTWPVEKFNAMDETIFNLLKNDYDHMQSTISFIDKMYVSNNNVKSPRFSPLLSDNETIKKLPQTLIIEGEFDLLRPHGIKYADKLSNAGIKTQIMTYLGMEHAFMDKYGILPQGEDVNREIVDWLLK